MTKYNAFCVCLALGLAFQMFIVTPLAGQTSAPTEAAPTEAVPTETAAPMTPPSMEASSTESDPVSTPPKEKTENTEKTEKTVETSAAEPVPEKKAFDPEKSFSRLAHPAVAARLGLSDEQRAEVQRLLVLRSQELAKAPQEQWETVVEQSEQKLADVLSPAQKTLWPKVFSEKTIRISFKMQSWADVLQWFAEQAGLQLVMDAPPPGTLHYADQRDYTPSEAIDVLNSVLQTKGYTLVRNDKMLMLFDLKRGRIPVQFLPKLKPENLPERGRFEYTTVIFPLERRNRANVIRNLEPFKGAYCQIVPMPGNSLMITDAAATLLVLQKVIESVENPPAPTAPESPPAPTPTVWKTYLVEKNDPARIETIFKEFAPTSKTLRVGNSKEIHVLLPEAEHQQLDDILKMLEADSGAPKGELLLASYSIAPYSASSPRQLWQLGRLRRGLPSSAAAPPPLNPYDNTLTIGTEIINLLKKTFPAAVVSDTPVAGNVVVLAPAPDQEKIKTFFESLKQVPRPEDEAVAKLYRYADKTKKMNDETLKQLRSVVPDGVFSLDDDRGQILVVASAKEQELLARAVTELEAAAMPEEDKAVVSYRMSASVATRFAAMLQQLVAKKELEGILQLRDSKQGQVTVWATARQHEMIQKILDEVSGGARAAVAADDGKPAEPVLCVYPMERGVAYTARLVLSTLIVGADFSYDYRTNAVIAVATPDIQEVVRKAVEELDKGVNDDVAFITLKKELPPDLLRQLARIAPKSIVVPNRRNLQVIVSGPRSELDKIKAILTASEATSGANEEILVHTLQTAAPATVVAVLAEVFPEVRATVNGVNNQLVLTMNSDVKEPVRSLLTQLDGALEFLPVRKTPSPQLLQSIRTLAPRTTVIPDTENAQIMLQGPAAEVEKVKKIVAQAETSTAIPEEVYVHPLKHVESPTVVSILKEIHPNLKIKDDTENGRLVIRMRPDQKEAITSLLAQLDAADPDREKRFFKAYAFDTGFYPLRTGRREGATNIPDDFIAGLQKLAPKAKIHLDDSSQQLIVWGTEEEHQAIGAAVQHMNDGGDGKKYGRFQLRRADPYLIMSIVRRMYPTVIPTFDYYGRSVIVEGHPRLLEKIREMVDTLDPAEPTPNDPVVRFYSLGAEPTPALVAGLQRLIPTAYIVPDKETKQLMVVARPDEQTIVEGNVKAIATFTAPEEPMLFIYPATPDQRERLEAFVKTAAKDLKGVAIVPDGSSVGLRQVSVWAKPSEHRLIATVLKQMHENRANEPVRQLKVFQMSIGDLVTAQEILNVSHPDATQFVDKQGNRLLVWATPDELDKVAKTLTIQGNLDNRQMLAYPVAGPKPETLMKVIQDVFQGLKITPEPQTRRLLVWASPEEHVRVAEIVEQANKKENPESALAEKFVAYSSAGLDPRTITPLFKALIPDADVYADTTADKITVRARTREHEQVKDLFEQLRQKDEKLRPVLVVYPIGDTDPVMIEALLRAQLQNAESMTADKIVELLGWSYYYERMPWYRSYNRQTMKKTGYFKVDPQTQSVYVFVSGDDHEDVAKAIEQLVAVGNREGVKPTVRRYSLEEMSFYDIYNLLYKIAPSGNFQPIYNYTPGRSNFYASYRDFLAYTRESEHEKIDALVREMNDRAGSGKKEMLSITIPDGSKFGRDKVIETIRKLYPDIAPMPGGAPNQVLVWSTAHRLEKIRQMIDEACKPLPENCQTVVKSYPLRYIGVEDAKNWLAAILPNASFDPEPSGTHQPPRPPGQAEPKWLVALATPLEHLEIAKALEQLDRDMPVTHKPVPRIYSLADQPVASFAPLRISLIQAFPNAVCTQGAEQQTILIVAPEDEHRQIAEFLKAFRDDREKNRPTLEVYALKKLNYYSVVPIIQRIAPPPKALILPASKPEQIGVWATPREHLDIAQALTQLETAVVEVDHQNLRIYKTGVNKAYTAVQILRYQFPGALVFAISRNEVFAWASPVQHDAMAKMLDTVAEAFPEPVLRTYYFKHVPLAEGFTVLNQMYTGQATLTVRPDTGDLMVHATPDIQGKIAANIAEFDVPRPTETESLPVAYDLSDIPLTQINYAAQSIRTALPQMVVLPSSIPGQIVVWGKAADQRKVRLMVDQMLTERPDSGARMQAYTIRRGTAVSVTPMLRLIAPNARFGYGTNPNQLLVWSKDADQQRIKNAVDKLNESDPDLCFETYSLKNVYGAGARALLQNLIATEGLNAKITYDYYGNQLVVQANDADQKTIAALLEKLRTEDRELEVFALETVDPITAYTAIQALFADESYYTTPGVEVDQNTNIIFVQGTRNQLEKTRKMLVNMGETQLLRQAQPVGAQPVAGPMTATTGSLPAAGKSQLRVIRIEGNTQDTIRELEKLWPQYQQNRLLINRQEEPLIQKKDEPPKPDAFLIPKTGSFIDEIGDQRERVDTAGAEAPLNSGLAGPKSSFAPVGFFSLTDDGKPGDNTPSDPAPATETPKTESAKTVAEMLQAAAPNVYVTVNEDETLTVASYDTEALDRLERILKRIEDRIVFEGRDYTIYSVRNISADLVSMKINLILRERLAGREQRYGAPSATRYQAPRLEIVPDLTTNTIYVRGAKAERSEVAKLIALLDVSELPGEQSVRKPVKVPIKNTQAPRVLQQVLNVYQQKMMSTRLPGGVYPRVTVDNVTNSLEIIAPEPLASELKEYAEDLDRRTVEEPARKIHVIPLEVKSPVIMRALNVIRQSSDSGSYYYQYSQGRR